MSKTKKVHKPQWTITDKPVRAFNIEANDYDISAHPIVNQHWNELLNRILVGETPTREDFFLCLGVIREYSDEGSITELQDRITELEEEVEDMGRTISHLEDENDKLSEEVSTLTENKDFTDFAEGAIK